MSNKRVEAVKEVVKNHESKLTDFKEELDGVTKRLMYMMTTLLVLSGVWVYFVQSVDSLPVRVVVMVALIVLVILTWVYYNRFLKKNREYRLMYSKMIERVKEEYPTVKLDKKKSINKYKEEISKK